MLAAVMLQPRTAARMSDRAPLGEIPFTLTDDGRMYVMAFVNGSDSLRFLVDTGASSVVLNVNSPRLKSRLLEGVKGYNLGTTGSSQIEYAKGYALRAGSMRFERVECAHIPYPPDYWDGVLGLGVLAEFNVEFNYDDLKIYFYPKRKVKPDPAYAALPFVYRYYVPFVKLPIRLNGKRHRLLLEVDTGADRVIDLSTPFVNRNRLLESLTPFAVSYITSSDGGTGQLKHVIFDEVAVGPYILPRVPGALSTLTSGMLAKEDIDGMIGNGFLKRFNMLIDFKSNKIYLQPNNLLYTQFYEFLVRKKSVGTVEN